LTVANGANFPDRNFRIVVDNEVIFVGSRNGNTLTNLVRGSGGTAAASHNTGAIIRIDGVANLAALPIIDRRINLGRGSDTSGGSLGSGVTDIRQLSNLGNVNLNSLSLPKAATEGTPGSATSSFTSGVTKPGAVYFKLLEAQTIFKLILGQPADIVIVQ